MTYLCFMSEKKLVKIGKTTDMKSRIRNIKTANPLVDYVHFCELDVEKLLHKCFNDFNYAREWFDYSEFGKQNFMKIVNKICHIRENCETDCEAYEKILILNE